jgi:hypothetical protein
MIFDWNLSAVNGIQEAHNQHNADKKAVCASFISPSPRSENQIITDYGPTQRNSSFG